MTYADGVFMGYRGFEKAGTAPLYPFGFGLSYTSFKYSDLKLSQNKLASGATVNATFTLTNTGREAGFEVAQLYVRPAKSAIARPKKELKGYAKVYLKGGESKTVSIPIDTRSLAYYDQSKGGWQVDAGKFGIAVGGSSADLPLDATLSVDKAEVLSTSTSNPLPLPLQRAVQVSSERAF
jgi:beta-glucosidase